MAQLRFHFKDMMFNLKGLGLAVLSGVFFALSFYQAYELINVYSVGVFWLVFFTGAMNFVIIMIGQVVSYCREFGTGVDDDAIVPYIWGEQKIYLYAIVLAVCSV